MARKALHNKNAPRGLHLSWYAVIWLLMDRAQAAPWAWGVVGTLCALVFILTAIDFFTAEDVEL